MEAYLVGNMSEACKIVDEYAESREGTGDELMWRLEQGKIKFDAGLYEDSLKAFERAEALITDFDDRAKVSLRDAGAETGAVFTNPNALPYKGFIYDRILVNVYKALDYLALGRRSDAMVEIRRVHQKQKEAEEYFASQAEQAENEIKKGREEMHKNNSASGDFEYALSSSEGIKKAYDEMLNDAGKKYGDFINPFALYLSALNYLMENDYNNANVDFRNLYKAEPSNKLICSDFAFSSKFLGNALPSEISSQSPCPYPLDKNIVFVIFENGISAALKEEKVQIILPPPIPTGYSGIAFPLVEKFHPPYTNIRVETSGKTYNGVDVADMDSIVKNEYEKIFPYIITRLVISTIVKEGASFAAQMAAEQAGGEWAKWGTVVATSIYKYTFNTADTRCWQTLPKQYIITHFPKPANGVVAITTEGGTAPRSETITLKPDSNFAIIYIRAQSQNYFLCKVFEFNTNNN